MKLLEIGVTHRPQPERNETVSKINQAVFSNRIENIKEKRRKKR